MKTPLPEPDMSHRKALDDCDEEYSYSKELVEAYGTAEYKRGIADAAQMCDLQDDNGDGVSGWFEILATKIRKLGEAE